MKSFYAVVLSVMLASNLALADTGPTLPVANNTVSRSNGDFYVGMFSVTQVFNLEYRGESFVFWARAYAIAHSGCESTINCARVVLALPDGASGFDTFELPNKLDRVISADITDSDGEEVVIRGVRSSLDHGGGPLDDRLVTLVVKFRKGDEWLDKLHVTEYLR